MFFEKSLVIFMGGFVVWGFLMAMFFNLMLIAFKAKEDFKLLFVSIVMFSSYFTSDHFNSVFSGSEVYKTWLIYDLVTLLVILPVFFFKKAKPSPGVIYAVAGLIFNSILLLLMHLDIVVLDNREKWWLWGFYSIGINLSDLLMIVALIVDRDILGFITLKDYVKRQVSSQKIVTSK
ncbi:MULTISPECIES: hypothetical protein [unclassified Pseudoalteromonas]|uniref:hypothetical protein n=1 Tax=unclassified Pseudoalteromonas TaxID=194690 RepID=UPI000CF6B25F|nr:MULTISPECIES: hypothetical protein [unclassified Pseudoalteromonas]